jgi:TPR repeat protein
MNGPFRCASLSKLLLAAVLAHVLPVSSGTVAAGASDRAPLSSEIIGTPEQRLKRNQVKATSGIGDEEFRSLQARALQGDKDAARRVALMFKRGSNGVPRDERRMLEWLLHASKLNNAAASYDLYLYFLEQKLDRDAVYFENRALEQGFVPPPRLDPRRG